MADSKKNLKYFMRSLEPEVVTAPGLDSFRGEDGKPIPFEVRVLSQERINQINEAYRKRSMATDKKGNPLIAMGGLTGRKTVYSNCLAEIDHKH